jgi:hypothetical protein
MRHLIVQPAATREQCAAGGSWNALISCRPPKDNAPRSEEETVDDVLSAMQQARREFGSDIGLSLPIWRPMFDQSSALVRTLTEAVAADIRYIDLEDAHSASREALTWARQAVRFARRS